MWNLLGEKSDSQPHTKIPSREGDQPLSGDAHVIVLYCVVMSQLHSKKTVAMPPAL